MITDWLDVSPAPNHVLTRYMLEPIDIGLQLQSPHSPEELQVQVWTNLPTRFNGDGTWYAIEIPYLETSHGHYRFQSSLRPTSPGDFELTYRVRHRANPKTMQWLAGPHDNAVLRVAPPAPDQEWTQRPNPVEIMAGVYVGNLMAASQAEALGFDAVLNMAEELNPTLGDGIAYRKLACRDGAGHPIPEDHLQAAVAWIEDQLCQGKQRVLVHCRAGIGRSGSVGVAYCFSKHPQWSYAQALDYVWSKKPDVYPHRQLQESLERLFPRAVRHSNQ